MEYVIVNKDNLDEENICCAIAKNNDIQVLSKKNWLNNMFDEGLVFLKAKERGKCFIEYLPAENAWNPLIAKDYMYIDCLWVAGSFKGNGYAGDLWNYCINDAKSKGKKGLCILSSEKKKPFLADPKFLSHKGFKVADKASNGIELWYLPFEDGDIPKFKDCAKHPHILDMGYILYYTNQCPFNGKYIPILEKVASDNNIPFKAIHLDTKEKAQNAPSPCTTYALFHNGDYISNEQMNETRFLKLIISKS